MDFLDFFDLFDLVLEPIFDFLLCRGDLDVWVRKRISDFILGAGNLIFLVILAAGIHSSSVFWIIVGAIGLAFFFFWDIRYSIWWIREGRFGGTPPWLDKISINFTDTLPEEVQLRSEAEDIWEKLGTRD